MTNISRQLIRKPARRGDITPNLLDYDRARAAFSWEDARRELSGLPNGGGLNIAHEAIDRHCNGPRAECVALRSIGKGGEVRDYTYTQMRALTNRFANVLRTLGVGKGDCVFTLTPRIPELYVAALGTFKTGAVFCPLFAAFGPEPIHTRMSIGKARVLVTTDALYVRKVASLRTRLPELEHVLLIRTAEEFLAAPGAHDLQALLRRASDRFVIPPTDSQDIALLHFTSGTTGMPKGAVHVHAAVIAHYASAKLALDLHRQDVFWCTADPGWVTGTAYGIIGPLVCGVRMIVDSEDFDARRWYTILEREAVTVWYTAPTAIRMLMKVGLEPLAGHDLSALRFAGSVGEPLNPEAVLWGADHLGLPFHDNWWQTETGGIMIANYACMDIRPGSMGRPLPGIEAGVVEVHEDGSVSAIEVPDKVGELALKPGWPSMFRMYLNQPEKYASCFRNGWYLSGDLARRDADGYFWFVGRADDVIKSAGHLISPFEVESALMQHPAVAQAAVIGLPDPLIYQVVHAYVELKPGFTADEALNRSLLAHARKQLGAAVAPREITVVDALPRTRSGKIMRRLLRARALGEPEGDLSTLEGPA
jgi:acetyl-CoA synthetase